MLDLLVQDLSVVQLTVFLKSCHIFLNLLPELRPLDIGHILVVFWHIIAIYSLVRTLSQILTILDVALVVFLAMLEGGLLPPLFLSANIFVVDALTSLEHGLRCFILQSRGFDYIGHSISPHLLLILGEMLAAQLLLVVAAECANCRRTRLQLLQFFLVLNFLGLHLDVVVLLTAPAPLEAHLLLRSLAVNERLNTLLLLLDGHILIKLC